MALSEGPSSDRDYVLSVGPVLIGHSPAAVTYHAVDGEPVMPKGSRWVVMTDVADAGLAQHPDALNGRWDQAEPVAPNGRIDWGRIVDAPATLSALLASFGLPPTDAASESPAAHPEPIAIWLTAVSLIAFGLSFSCLRRRGHPRGDVS